MSILDETGQTPSITRGGRALALFTDRYSLIRAFTRTLHEDDALGKILFFHGGGGNGKSLLLRFLQRHGCKRFHHWDELRRQPDAEFVRRLQDDPAFVPLPVAHLDFHAPPREFEQPTVDYDALLMLRRQLGTFRASGVARLRFPVYDFAAVLYLYRTQKLTKERLRSLFPDEEIGLVTELADAVTGIQFFKIGEAVLRLFDRHLQERWTLFRQRRGVDGALIEELQAMDPNDLVLEMPRLFALDLNAALAAADAPSRIVLLLDGHDAFTSEGETFSLAPEGDRDRWLRYLLAALDLKGGIVPIVTGRREPRWPEQEPYTIPDPFLESCHVDHFSDADANVYLQKAFEPTGVDDPALRARLCDYARVRPDEVHPLYAGLGADVVLQAARRGRRLMAKDFPEEPDAGKKPQLLAERLLRWADTDVEYAVRSLAAARAFDRALFEALGQWERSRYAASDAAFDTLTGFSFVWEEEGRGAGWYSVHALLRRVLRERGDERLREADAALEAIHRERAEGGEPLALAEAVYHAYQQDSERGLKEWVATFEQARQGSRYELCEALRTVGTEFEPEEPWWRARMAQEEGGYLLIRSRYTEADESLQASVAAYDEALSRAPDDTSAHNNKGLTLNSRGDLFARLSHHEEAERAYGEAVAAYDEALSRAPDDTNAYNNKGSVLQRRGDLLAGLSRHKEAERAYGEAVAAYDKAISRAPDYVNAHNNKGAALSSRGDLLARLSRHEEAERSYGEAVAAFNEVLSRAPDLSLVRNNKGVALSSRGNLLAELSRHEEAERAYAEAVAAYDKALSRAPDFLQAHNNKGLALSSRGNLLARLSRHKEAERNYGEAVAAFNEALSHAPDLSQAHSNKGNALKSRGDLLAGLSRHKEAERAYAEAVAAFNEALSRAPDSINAHNNKGAALKRRGDLLAGLSRHGEAERAYGEAVAAYEEALSRAPDDTYAYNNKGNALQRRGDLLAGLSRHGEAERVYGEAVAAYDEALSRAPDSVNEHYNKALALLRWGEHAQFLGQNDVVRARWEVAQTHAERVLTLAPQREQARRLLALIRQWLDDLDAGSSSEE